MKRVVVGAHYGLTDWLAQRVTALIMAAYSLLLLGIALYNGGFSYELWTLLFANNAFQLASFVFMLSLLWHAWIGLRDVWMDYVKPTGLRLTLEVLTLVALVVYAGWVVEILWAGK